MRAAGTGQVATAAMADTHQAVMPDIPQAAMKDMATGRDIRVT
jgi:hypothetical protein